MNNFEVGERLLAQAEVIMAQEVPNAYAQRLWGLVIRRSQEVVELSLKALLKILGIEYPKEHDVGDVLVRVCAEKNIEVDHQVLGEIRRISADLANERAAAFYGERAYEEGEAREARLGAEKVLKFSQELAEKLKVNSR